MINLIFSFLHSIRKTFRKITGVKTFGARAIIFHHQKILLVKHRYNDLWVLPGGKIDKKMTAEQTIIKELLEEVTISVKSIEYLLGTYQNNSGGKNDEVSVFVIGEWFYNHEYKQGIIDKLEIKEQKWFALDELPDTTSNATRNRINEFIEGKRDLIGSW